MRKIRAWFAEHTIGAIISLFRNVGYWARRGRRRWGNTCNCMELLRAQVTSIDRAVKIMSEFEWHEEGTDWTPWTITVVHRFMTGAMDDCDGAAVLWVWLFRCAGHKAYLWHLRGDDGGHAVAVTRDGKYMGTNAELYQFADPDHWQAELLEKRWGGKYDFIFR